jgi:hypothetical protein
MQDKNVQASSTNNKNNYFQGTFNRCQFKRDGMQPVFEIVREISKSLPQGFFYPARCSSNIKRTNNATHCLICALIAPDLRASEASKAFHASSRSDNDRPDGGTYSRRPYVLSFVCTFPKSVATSCRSVTHERFVVCL